MKTRRHPLAASALLLLVLALAPQALHAQLTKIFVASYGNDANDGSRGSPKRNFQPAHDAVAAGGQIVVLDTAGYGQLNITKSLAVTVPPGVNGFVTVTGPTTNAITVAAGAGSTVSLRGLIIEGGGSRQSLNVGSGFGIYVTSVGFLTVEDCTIRNFLDALPFLPGNGDAHLSMFNCAVRNCRYGIDVQGLAGNQGTRAVISGCRLENLGDAVYASGSGSSIVVVENSVITHCDISFHLATGGALYVSGCQLTYLNSLVTRENGTFNGVFSFGNNTRVLANTGKFDFTNPLE